MHKLSRGLSKRKTYFSMAVDKVIFRPQKKKENVKKKVELRQESHKWSKIQKDDLLEDIESYHQHLQDLESHLSNPESKAVKYMNKRRYYKIVNKCGPGRCK